MTTPTNPSEDLDKVEVASNDSFPASDPPAWGSSHAAPSETTVCADLTPPPSKLRYVKWFGVGALVAGALAAASFAIYRARR